MPDYTVQKGCRPGVEYKAPGEDVTLTEGQAKYLVMSGHLKLKTADTKTQKPAKAKKADGK